MLLIQTGGMVLFASLVTFRFMGSNYDSAIIAGGHCGFGMGATPTAVANMEALTQRYGVVAVVTQAGQQGPAGWHRAWAGSPWWLWLPGAPQ